MINDCLGISDDSESYQMPFSHVISNSLFLDLKIYRDVEELFWISHYTPAEQI